MGDYWEFCWICWGIAGIASLGAGVGYEVSRFGVEDESDERSGGRGVSCLKSRVYVPSALLAAGRVLVARAL